VINYVCVYFQNLMQWPSATCTSHGLNIRWNDIRLIDIRRTGIPWSVRILFHRFSKLIPTVVSMLHHYIIDEPASYSAQCQQRYWVLEKTYDALWGQIVSIATLSAYKRFYVGLAVPVTSIYTNQIILMQTSFIFSCKVCRHSAIEAVSTVSLNCL